MGKNTANKIVAGVVSGIVIGSIGTSYVISAQSAQEAKAAAAPVTAQSTGAAPGASSGAGTGTGKSSGSASTPQQQAKGGRGHRGAASLDSVQSINVADGQYKDGTYTGEANGYAPGMQVQVTIQSSRITDVRVTKHNETPGFYETAFRVVPQEIIQSQSTKVDTVSRATYSSVGIINAVNNALTKAQG